MAYSAFRFRNFLAASRKSNIYDFGLLDRRRGLDFISNSTAGDNETVVPVTGTKNGVNVSFTAGGGFNSLWWNGVRMLEGADYTLSGSVNITMAVPPGASDTLYAIG